MVAFKLFPVLALFFVSFAAASTAHSSAVESASAIDEEVMTITTFIYTTTTVAKVVETVNSVASDLPNGPASSVTDGGLTIQTSTPVSVL